MPFRVNLFPTVLLPNKAKHDYPDGTQIGQFDVGNGPNRIYSLCLEIRDGLRTEIRIDQNRNGDFSDDPKLKWPEQMDTNQGFYEGSLEVSLRASYGTANKETSTCAQTVVFYRYATAERSSLFLYQRTQRAGRVKIGNEFYDVRLHPNTENAIYPPPSADPENQVALTIDFDRNGNFSKYWFNTSWPIHLGATQYRVQYPLDGSSIRFIKVPKSSKSRRRQ